MIGDEKRTLGTIERKSLLYKSGLGFFCINHVQGCSHGCRYPCYAFMMSKHHGRVSDYAAWCRPRVVGNALELLERELRRKRALPMSVHLCLSTDPFMVGYPEIGALSLAMVERLNRAGVACSLLTKGVLPVELADQRRFPCDNTYGASLVALDESFRAKWEPGAAPYRERIQALRRLHEAGRRTRVHIEPYPTPNLLVQDLPTLLGSIAFVDHLYFSGWNYNPRATECQDREGFYRRQSAIVRQFCREHRIEQESA
jgi:DNA repair photolyase